MTAELPDVPEIIAAWQVVQGEGRIEGVDSDDILVGPRAGYIDIEVTQKHCPPICTSRMSPERVRHLAAVLLQAAKQAEEWQAERDRWST